MSGIDLDLTPRQRLAASRQKLLDAMGYLPMTSNVCGQPMLGQAAGGATPRRSFTLNLLPEPLRNSVAAQWAVRWWKNHPVHDVADLGRPYLQDYAQRHPGKLLAYSAGAGAVLWLAKPWRIVSTAAILSLAVKAGAKGMLRAGARRRLE